MIADPLQRTRAIAAADRQVNRRTLRPLKDLELVTVVRPFLRGETTPLAQKEVVVLTRSGAEVVRQLYAGQDRGQVVRWHRSWLEIDGTNQAHASLISDFYITMRRALPEGWRLQGWRDDREIAQLVQQGMTTLNSLIPDAAFVLAGPGDHGDQEQPLLHAPFFLEIDLATESIMSSRQPTRDITAKFERYRSYLSGPWRHDPFLGGISSSPRLLFLTTSNRRLEAVMEAAARVHMDEAVLCSTLDRLAGDVEPHSAIWGTAWRSLVGGGVTMLGDAWLS